MMYWVERNRETAAKISAKTEKETRKKIQLLYEKAMRQTIRDFESTYNHLLTAIEKDREPTPADLYKLDSYWKMQAQLKVMAEKLGSKQVQILSKAFEAEWIAIYEGIAIPGSPMFTTVAADVAAALVNSVWLADGKSFSDRVWNNTEKLVETLNEELVHCVVTGRKTSDLTKILRQRFGVSFSQADTLVRTEVCHIQTQAAAQRYQDYGIEKYRFLADPDERTCDVCGKLDGKEFFFSEMTPGVNAPPMHPRDRCTIVPVV